MIHSEPRLLYVEDEVILAINFADNMRREYDVDVVLAHNLTSARALIAEEQFVWALLDVNLGNNEQSTDLMRDLDIAGTQVVFVSGYNQISGPETPQKPHIEKPFQVVDVAKAFGFTRTPKAA